MYSCNVHQWLEDRLYIPARCCKTAIPRDWIRDALSPEEYVRYAGYEAEANRDPRLNELKNDAQYKETVTALEWKLCPQCGVGVERLKGCAHMTCKCDFEFCYHCRATFKPQRQCNCPLFTEEELVAMVHQVAPRADRALRERLRQVYQAHDVHVHTWRKQQIGSRNKRCRNCPLVCNQWYFQCTDCLQNQCGPCAFNRPR